MTLPNIEILPQKFKPTRSWAQNPLIAPKIEEPSTEFAQVEFFVLEPTFLFLTLMNFDSSFTSGYVPKQFLNQWLCT
jgi:hypothetical protein